MSYEQCVCMALRSYQDGWLPGVDLSPRLDTRRVIHRPMTRVLSCAESGMRSRVANLVLEGSSSKSGLRALQCL